MVDEYQTATSLLKIDRVLAELAERKSYTSADELTDEILTAETYKLLSHLEVCIEKASKFSHNAFIRNPKFNCISDNAKSKLFLLRCKYIDLTIGKCINVANTSVDDKVCHQCKDKFQNYKSNIINIFKEVNQSK